MLKIFILSGLFGALFGAGVYYFNPGITMPFGMAAFGIMFGVVGCSIKGLPAQRTKSLSSEENTSDER